LQLKPGLTGFARIKNRRTLLAIPSVSVINPVKDEATAFVVDSNGVVHIRPVKIGMAMEGFTEVVGGLAEGENVVTVGQANLRDGDKVRIGKDRSVSGDAGEGE
jgi:multidrug efflux pump subunit AcrA (membrane-fusion protein)